MAGLPRISIHRGDGEHLRVDLEDCFWVDFWCDGELCWINVEKYEEPKDWQPKWLRGWYIKLFLGSKYIKEESQVLLDFMTANGCYAGMSPREMFINLLGAEDGS